MSIWRSISSLLKRMPAAEARIVARQRLVLAGSLGMAFFILIAMQVVSLAMVEARAGGYRLSGDDNPLRGKVYDRKGRVLATSLPAFMLYADPAEVMNPYEATLQLAELLPGLTEEEIFAKLTQKGRFSEISWKVSPATYAKTLKAGIVGVYGRKRITRFYPHRQEAAHILGAVNKDNIGIAGIEAGMQDRLIRGEDVHLSIDIAIQSILRHEITEQITKFEAIGGAGVVMDVETGEIIAMVSLPDYDANYLADASPDSLFNRATKGVYELGSTFKIFNTAMAVDSGVFSLDDMIDVVSPLRVGRFPIRDFHPEKTPLNVAEVMVVSSNKGSARIADTLGPQLQQRYINALGLTSPLPLEIPEVAAPIVPSRWKRAEVMTISYGHGLSVTPTHLAAAIATTIGDGTRVVPSLVKGGAASPISEEVFSEKTVRQIRPIMRRVVTHPRGTGKKADARGYSVGGKTGTSEKISTTGGYSRKANIASFVGAFPSHAPRYVVMVMVDEPKGQKFSFNYATGGWVAAPAVGRFINRAAPMLDVAPVNEKSPEIRQILMVNLPQLDMEVKNASY
ncbi:peptidoglycan D,D-transpeptidase FtsI family protein [Alphaproteobacteria bacterium LSUCC0684]